MFNNETNFHSHTQTLFIVIQIITDKSKKNSYPGLVYYK